MEDLIQVDDQFYVLATSPRADDRTRVIKHGETFAVFDRRGDVQAYGLGEQGIYHAGTRYLSRLELRLGSSRPLLLSSTVGDRNEMVSVDLTNPDMPSADGGLIRRGALHVFRSKLLWEGRCYERLRLSNFGMEAVTIAVGLAFDADFADIFEIRGTTRARRGVRLPAEVTDGALVLAYRGLDGVVRRTRIEWRPRPDLAVAEQARYDVRLEPQEHRSFYLTLSLESEGETVAPLVSYDEAVAGAAAARAAARDEGCVVHTSNTQFNDWINRSLADLHMMLTATPSGPYPYAGVPWYSTAFGRDGLVTALELLWVNPQVARGVLAFLAANQAQASLPEQDAEPGKILHETRRGEMAALREIPFGCYYGSVDATPLFVTLAGRYHERTADDSFLESLWPAVEAALAWIDAYGDRDGDGFVEYARRGTSGLQHQGWKDSQDPVFHEDGELAEPPIALCEVQGYVYEARLQAASMAEALGHASRAAELRTQAGELKERFEAAFWIEELGTLALALDRDKRPCRVRTSNAGHCLLSGIVRKDRAQRLAQALLREDSFTGWGIRTVSSVERRYNPMSYHNGSVWPHDNALIALGLARYGFTELAARLLTSFFDASLFLDLHRMPELFCGFPRRPSEGPTLYPVACAPQSWAAGAVFLLLQAALGMHLDAARGQVVLSHPVLPRFLETITLTNVAVGESRVDLELEWRPTDVGVTILRRSGPVEVVVVK